MRTRFSIGNVFVRKETYYVVPELHFFTFIDSRLYNSLEMSSKIELLLQKFKCARESGLSHMETTATSLETVHSAWQEPLSLNSHCKDRSNKSSEKALAFSREVWNHQEIDTMLLEKGGKSI